MNREKDNPRHPATFRRISFREPPVENTLIGHDTLLIECGVQPRMTFLRTGQSVMGFERRLHTAGLEVPVVYLKEGETWRAPLAGKDLNRCNQ